MSNSEEIKNSNLILTPEVNSDQTSEKTKYMISPRHNLNVQMAGFQPMSTSSMDQTLTTLGIDVIGHIKRSEGTIQTLGVGGNQATDIVLTKIEPNRAELLKKTLPINLMIAEDKPLHYRDSIQSKEEFPSIRKFSSTAETKTRKFKFRILGDNEKPLSKVTVQLTGDTFPNQAITNEQGEIEIEVVTLGDTPPRLLSVMVANSYWDLYLPNPKIVENTINIIKMRPFSDTVSDFPKQFQYGWGQRLMGLDKLPKEINGSGIKIAIIDSGCDNTHPLLQHIQFGKDFTENSNENSWNQDSIGHGTHCAGIIAAHGEENTMMRGFAPKAEIHILKVFPGGQYSSLIQALDYCINHQIDVINMSLGGDSEINSIVEETLQIAAQNGIACIVAAGNSGDAVKYPASSHQTLAVAAIGSLKNLHPYTWEATQVKEGTVTTDEMFSPSFTCFGPEIAVCAPGVEIISTVPGGAFDAMSGTSMAAPHITGLAALLLAHHPLFSTQYQARNSQRVAALFNIICSLCTPYNLDSSRTGYGLPKLDKIITVLQNIPTFTANSSLQSTNTGVVPVANTGVVPIANSGVAPVTNMGIVPVAHMGIVSVIPNMHTN